jgi:mono/diheme cytochrome c family protein
MRATALTIASLCVLAILPWPSRAGDLGPIGDGRRAWLKLNCYGCHGNNAGGGMGPNIRGAESGDVKEAMSGDAMEGGMRSFNKYASSTDAANISAYLRSIGTSKEPKWLDWWNPTP